MVGVSLSDRLAASALSAFDDKIAELKRDGPTPRAIIVSNPGNPIGHVLPDETLLEYCRIAERHDLHVYVAVQLSSTGQSSRTDVTASSTRSTRSACSHRPTLPSRRASAPSSALTFAKRPAVIRLVCTSSVRLPCGSQLTLSDGASKDWLGALSQMASLLF